MYEKKKEKKKKNKEEAKICMEKRRKLKYV